MLSSPLLIIFVTDFTNCYYNKKLSLLCNLITVPDEVRFSYNNETDRRRSVADSGRGSDFWEIVLSPRNPDCSFNKFNFQAASVLQASESKIHLAYDIAMNMPNIDFNISFNDGCLVDSNATDLYFDKTVPAPVMPRFYSIDRSDQHYQIEFGWDTVGYMYVFGNLSNLVVPQMLLSMPCAYELDANSIRFINYRSGSFI